MQDRNPTRREWVAPQVRRLGKFEEVTQSGGTKDVGNFDGEVFNNQNLFSI